MRLRFGASGAEKLCVLGAMTWHFGAAPQLSPLDVCLSAAVYLALHLRYLAV
jgi:hypothetical protein